MVRSNGVFCGEEEERDKEQQEGPGTVSTKGKLAVVVTFLLSNANGNEAGGMDTLNLQQRFPLSDPLRRYLFLTPIVLCSCCCCC